MEENKSFQNGQESKELEMLGESPFVTSNGMEMDYYHSTAKEIGSPNKYTDVSQNQKLGREEGSPGLCNYSVQKCYTEQREELPIKEADEASKKLDQLFDEAAKNEQFPINQTFDYKASVAPPSQGSGDRDPQEFPKFENQNNEMVRTPQKKGSQASEALKLSSVKVEFSDEGELQSSSGGNGFSSRGHPPQKPINMSQADLRSKAEVLFNTPQISDKVSNGFEDQMHATMPLKEYPAPEQSEEQKSDLVNTSQQVIPEEDKLEENASDKMSEKDKKMLDFIQHLDRMINQTKSIGSGSHEVEEEGKLQLNRQSSTKNGRLIDFGDSKEQSESRSSIHGTFSRNSLTTLENEDLETKEGWLLKRSYKSPNFLGWQRRYCVVKNQKLIYYKTDDKKKVDGVIDFNLLTCLITVPRNYVGESMAGTSFKIDILASNRYFEFLICDDEDDDIMDWLRVVQKHQETSRGNREDFTRVAIQPNFWKNLRCSEEDFIKNANTGDILLFRAKSFIAKAQRFFTRSEYDHVAMLFKFSDKLVIFESTGQTGVDLLDWNAFMNNKWHNLYTKLVYRRLHYSLSEDDIEKLEDFAQKVRGKKYKMNPVKMCRRKSKRDACEDIKETKSYFCSELIASAFKRIGLLPEDISATRYWPSAFSLNSDTELGNGAWLGDEYQIDFSL